MANENNPIKQHTTPRFYLKKFADKNQFLWVFDKKRQEIRKQSVKDTTIEKDFYTLIEKGRKDYKVEKELFSQGIEKEFAKILNKIISNKKIENEDKGVISRFVLFQFGRTTSFKNDYERIYKKKMEQQITNEFSQKLKDKGINRIEIKPHININLKGMVVFYKHFLKILMEMNFDLFETSGNGMNQFITSDNPVIFLKAKRYRGKAGEVIAIIPSIVYFPLTPNLSLFICDDSNKHYFDKNKKLIIFLNNALIKQSDRYLISRGRKNLLSLI